MTDLQPERRFIADGPLVSVIVIFHNEERFLAEALDSVMAQSYESWELLLCDDGSTDGSTKLPGRTSNGAQIAFGISHTSLTRTVG